MPGRFFRISVIPASFAEPLPVRQPGAGMLRPRSEHPFRIHPPTDAPPGCPAFRGSRRRWCHHRLSARHKEPDSGFSGSTGRAGNKPVKAPPRSGLPAHSPSSSARARWVSRSSGSRSTAVSATVAACVISNSTGTGNEANSLVCRRTIPVAARSISAAPVDATKTGGPRFQTGLLVNPSWVSIPVPPHAVGFTDACPTFAAVAGSVCDFMVGASGRTINCTVVYRTRRSIPSASTTIAVA